MHEKTLSDVAADELRKHRKRLGLSREQLGEECAKLGAPDLTAAAITNIETGRRKTGKRRREITIDELMVLGHALAVPPLLLVLPLGELDEVPVPPGPKGQHPHAVWKWVIGEEPPGRVGEDGRLYADHRFEQWRAAQYPAELYQRLWTAQKALRDAGNRVHFARQRSGDDSDAARQAQRERFDRLTEFGEVLNEMTTAGIRVPAYDREWVDDLRGLGILRHPDAVPVFEPDRSTR